MRYGCAVVVLLAWGCGDTRAPQAKDDPSPRLILDESLFEKPEGVLGAWLAYGQHRLVWAETKYLKENPEQTVYKYSFAEELEARDTLCQLWKELKKGDSDDYLDALLMVREAGYLPEHVWQYLHAPEWGARPKELQTLRFSQWERENLKGHRPQTLAVARPAGIAVPRDQVERQ